MSRSLDDLEARAAKFWPDSITERSQKSSVIPRLIDSQEKYNARRVDHPCQLPPALMRRLIALFTCEGESVLDPFNGAGTTSLCAEQLRRKFIGIELSEACHQLVLSRHETLRQGEDPFAKATRNLQAKNSRVRRIGGIDYKVSRKVLQA